jgi:hypothetical protein
VELGHILQGQNLQRLPKKYELRNLPMALIKCPECQKQCSDKALKCINCGYPIASIQRAEETSPLEAIYPKIQSIYSGSRVSVKVLPQGKTLKIELNRSGVKILPPAYDILWHKVRQLLNPEILKGYTTLIGTAKFDGDGKTEWSRESSITPDGKVVITAKESILSS